MRLYTATSLIAVLIVLATIADIRTNRMISKLDRRHAVICGCIIILCAVCEWVGQMVDGNETFIVVHTCAKLLELCMAPAIGVAVAVSYGDAIGTKTAIAVTLCQSVFQCIAFTQGWNFYIDAGGFYHRGIMFEVSVIAFLFSLLYGVICMIRAEIRYQAKFNGVLTLTLVLLAVGTGSLFITGYPRASYLSMALSNMLFYIEFYRMTLQIDGVTKLLNRRCYETALMSVKPGSIILLTDLNDFKVVNDTYGHSAGDLCLIRTAAIMRKVYGRYGQCFRIGGDEYAVILSRHTQDIKQLNAAFTKSVEQMVSEDSRMTEVSLGYAYVNTMDEDVHSVVELADQELYRNKQKRPRVHRTKQ